MDNIMKLCGFTHIWNELSRGHLERLINNYKMFCDDIAIYDDGSTDGSPDYCEKEGCLVVRGERNDLAFQLRNRQILLNKVLEEIKPDWIFWLDADEIVDRKGTLEGIRDLMDEKKDKMYSFREITLWRSENWKRVDTSWLNRFFVRLWPVRKSIRFMNHQKLPSPRQYPIYTPDLPVVKNEDITILHYGYANIDHILERFRKRGEKKIPFRLKKSTMRHAHEGTLQLERVLNDQYPPGFEPEDYPKPKPCKELLFDLKPYGGPIKKWRK